MTIAQFIERFREAFGEAAPLPIAVFYTDELGDAEYASIPPQSKRGYYAFLHNNYPKYIMWRYKGQKRIQRMQYFFWAMYPFFKLVGMWNRMSEVADAMIEVSKNGYHKAAFECRNISRLVKP